MKSEMAGTAKAMLKRCLRLSYSQSRVRVSLSNVAALRRKAVGDLAESPAHKQGVYRTIAGPYDWARATGDCDPALGSRRRQMHDARALADEIEVALWRLHWLKVTAPRHARYHLHGRVGEEGRGSMRVTVRLLDAMNGRFLWAASWDGDLHDPIGFDDRIASGVARAIQPAVRAPKWSVHRV